MIAIQPRPFQGTAARETALSAATALASSLSFVVKEAPTMLRSLRTADPEIARVIARERTIVAAAAELSALHLISPSEVAEILRAGSRYERAVLESLPANALRAELRRRGEPR